jgi:hypothetical protein
MLTKSKIALSLVFVLATASPSGSVSPAGSVDKPSNISPQGYDRLKRLMEDFQDLGS